MKYFSEITGNMYTSEQELLDAEAEFLHCDQCTDEDLDCDECVKNFIAKKDHKDVNTETPSRKYLASLVEEADQDVKEAYSNLEVAKKSVEELSKDYLKAVDELIKPAEARVKEAEKARYNAIRRFNETYGVYQKTVSGAEAADELEKAIKHIHTLTGPFLPRWFFG